jgi:tetratricopeptide (TPR) repeat protein
MTLKGLTRGMSVALTICASAVVLCLLMLSAADAQQMSVTAKSPTTPQAPPPPDAAEALVAAQRQLAQAEQQYGEQALQLVNPLIALAAAQQRAKDDVGATKNYRRAMALVEAHQGTESHELVTALAGLGAIYAENGDHDASAEMLRRALDASRKVDGLLNPEQLTLLDSLIANYLALGDYDSVLREQQMAMRVAVSAYGNDIPRLVDELERSAGWYESMGRYTTARKLHTRTLLIASNLGKEKNLMMIEPLRGVTRTHRLEFLYGLENPTIDAYGASTYTRPNREGETALKLVIEILDAHPESGAGEQARARLDLGDWRMLAGYNDQAIEAYRDAWAALSAPDAGGTSAFDAPVQIYYRPPSATHRPPDTDKFTERFVEVRFTVAADGTVKDATLGPTDAPDKSARLVMRALKDARYRPRFVDGAAAATTGVKYRETIYVPKGP